MCSNTSDQWLQNKNICTPPFMLIFCFQPWWWKGGGGWSIIWGEKWRNHVFPWPPQDILRGLQSLRGSEDSRICATHVLQTVPLSEKSLEKTALSVSSPMFLSPHLSVFSGSASRSPTCQASHHVRVSDQAGVWNRTSGGVPGSQSSPWPAEVLPGNSVMPSAAPLRCADTGPVGVWSSLLPAAVVEVSHWWNVLCCLGVKLYFDLFDLAKALKPHLTLPEQVPWTRHRWSRVVLIFLRVIGGLQRFMRCLGSHWWNAFGPLQCLRLHKALEGLGRSVKRSCRLWMKSNMLSGPWWGYSGHGSWVFEVPVVFEEVWWSGVKMFQDHGRGSIWPWTVSWSPREGVQGLVKRFSGSGVRFRTELCSGVFV